MAGFANQCEITLDNSIVNLLITLGIYRNSEAVKVAPISSDTQAVGYDYDSSSAAYSSQYGQYPQGQYPSNWSSQAPVPSADPSVYGQSYVNQPTSWNSFYA